MIQPDTIDWKGTQRWLALTKGHCRPVDRAESKWQNGNSIAQQPVRIANYFSCVLCIGRLLIPRPNNRDRFMQISTIVFSLPAVAPFADFVIRISPIVWKQMHFYTARASNATLHPHFFFTILAWRNGRSFVVPFSPLVASSFFLHPWRRCELFFARPGLLEEEIDADVFSGRTWKKVFLRGSLIGRMIGNFFYYLSLIY